MIKSITPTLVQDSQLPTVNSNECEKNSKKNHTSHLKLSPRLTPLSQLIGLGAL